jgi:hypothetical protein
MLPLEEFIKIKKFNKNHSHGMPMRRTSHENGMQSRQQARTQGASAALKRKPLPFGPVWGLIFTTLWTPADEPT